MDRESVELSLALMGSGTVEEDEIIIVTRHAFTVEWLRGMGVTGRVIAHATPEDVRGKHVFGALPPHLAALAETVTTISMPSLPAEWRGRDLTVEEMRDAGARLETYVVTRVKRALTARDLKEADELVDAGIALDYSDAIGWYLERDREVDFPYPEDIPRSPEYWKTLRGED